MLWRRFCLLRRTRSFGDVDCTLYHNINTRIRWKYTVNNAHIYIHTNTHTHNVRTAAKAAFKKRKKETPVNKKRRPRNSTEHFQ